ncbi:gamma-glutamyl-gamma-aminobutyrate hydrolase family protein [bacterium]|nr:gamma-glutamyl-gamma-aminobutyrate hydrolase family protein [bacterium]MCI0604984.1 gamma-glutamyl-gamma-aminobutyrate hydrolase family protein [bacterium]
MKKPLIGIASDGMRRVPKYQRSVELAGADVEVLLPRAVTMDVIDHLNGMLLTGGGDIDAKEFDEVNHPMVHHINRDRDEMELTLTREALRRGIPVFGICRGVQLINVALGGNLIQHIPDEIKTLIVHDSKKAPGNPGHDVSILQGTRLHAIIGKDRVSVNSFHHQSVKDLGKGLIATAWSDDGVVEGLELPDARYFLGVQWHPEEFVDHGATFHSLFESFVNACK